MKFNLKNLSLFKIILSLSLISFFFFLNLIFIEYNKLKSFKKNLTPQIFLIDIFNQLYNSSFQNKRIKFSDDVSFLKINDENFEDNGFILFSGYSENEGSSITQIYSLQEKKIIHKWIPPILDIHNVTPKHVSEYNLIKNYRMQHPLLTEKGDLIFGRGEGPIAKIDSCSDLIWAIDRHFHHSIEYYKNNIVSVPIIILNNNKLNFPILDHGFALVDISSGKIIREYSIIDILIENQYIGLLFGVGEFEYDRIHLNDAEIIKKSDNYFLEGDVMLSSKHLSTVFVFRPSTNKVIWLKTGPWLNQHDIDYQGNGIFTIYGNDTFRYGLVDSYDVFYSSNNIYKYNFPKNTIDKIFSNYMTDITTPTQGLHQILNNGDVFVEETDNFKIHRFGKTQKRWQFVNLIDDNKIGSIHWSRYLTDKTNMKWLKESKCDFN